MAELRFQRNNFCGDTDFSQLPGEMYELDVSENVNLCGRRFIEDEAKEFYSDGSQVDFYWEEED